MPDREIKQETIKNINIGIASYETDNIGFDTQSTENTLREPVVNGSLYTNKGRIGGDENNWTIAENDLYATYKSDGNLYFRAGKNNFSDTANGFCIGIDNGVPKFIFGNATKYISWDGSDLVIKGSLEASEIHIPDKNTTVNSFHVDTDGNMWMGCTYNSFVASNENAKFYVLKDGTMKMRPTNTGSVVQIVTNATDGKTGNVLEILSSTGSVIGKIGYNDYGASADYDETYIYLRHEVDASANYEPLVHFQNAGTGVVLSGYKSNSNDTGNDPAFYFRTDQKDGSGMQIDGMTQAGHEDDYDTQLLHIKQYQEGEGLLVEAIRTGALYNPAVSIQLTGTGDVLNIEGTADDDTQPIVGLRLDIENSGTAGAYAMSFANADTTASDWTKGKDIYVLDSAGTDYYLKIYTEMGDPSTSPYKIKPYAWRFVGYRTDGMTEYFSSTGSAGRRFATSWFENTGAEFCLYNDSAMSIIEFDWGVDMTFYAAVKYETNISGNDSFFGLGEDGETYPGDVYGGTWNKRWIGFWYDRATAKMYALTCNGDGTCTSTEVLALANISSTHIYEFSFDAGTDCKFYVDGVLKATHTTDLPTDNSTEPRLMFATHKVGGNCQFTIGNGYMVSFNKVGTE